jgi:prepilin-type N-terminal cleavage/methylation domain-containing protein
MTSEPVEPHRDAGFTLVELLVVMVVMPLLVAAIAAAIISVERNSGVTQSRLSDTLNAQTTSAYFVRDVQAAQFLTTNGAITAPHTAISPQLCGSGAKLLLGLYRPASSSLNGVGSTLSVGYWASAPVNNMSQVSRYTCSVNTNYQTTVTSTELISNDAPATPSGALITPGQFATAASTGWAPTTASTTLAAQVNLVASQLTNIPVQSSAAFDTGQPITVTTASGLVTAPCASANPTTFLNCRPTKTGTAGPGYAVTQPASVSGVTLSVLETKTGYPYALSGVPRSWSSLAAGASSSTNPIGGVALLTLGSGITIQGGNQATLKVEGTIVIDNGTMSCTGNPTITAYGFGAVAGSTAFGTCASGAPTTTSPFIPDPIGPFLPGPPPAKSYPVPSGVPHFAQQPAGTTHVDSVNGGTDCRPGEYTTTLPCTNFEPGVYVLDHGFSGSAQMAADAPAGQGVLFYLPCNPPSAPTTCNETFSMGGSDTLALPPLTDAQSVSYFGTTALAGVFLWQDQGDSAAATFGGTASGSTPGTLYLPRAPITFQGTGQSTPVVGRVIAQSIAFAGSPNLTITGQ